MLKDLNTGKILKTKSEVSALQDFISWLGRAKGDSDGVILLCHEPERKVPINTPFIFKVVLFIPSCIPGAGPAAAPGSVQIQPGVLLQRGGGGLLQHARGHLRAGGQGQDHVTLSPLPLQDCARGHQPQHRLRCGQVRCEAA